MNGNGRVDGADVPAGSVCLRKPSALPIGDDTAEADAGGISAARVLEAGGGFAHAIRLGLIAAGAGDSSDDTRGIRRDRHRITPNFREHRRWWRSLIWGSANAKEVAARKLDASRRTEQQAPEAAESRQRVWVQN